MCSTCQWGMEALKCQKQAAVVETKLHVEAVGEHGSGHLAGRAAAHPQQSVCILPHTYMVLKLVCDMRQDWPGASGGANSAASFNLSRPHCTHMVLKLVCDTGQDWPGASGGTISAASLMSTVFLRPSLR